jgi:hypothetical protein
MINRLKTPILNPATDILVPLLFPLHDVRIENQKPLPLDTPHPDLLVFCKASSWVPWRADAVIVGDAAAGNDAAEILHGRQSDVEEFSAYVVVAISHIRLKPRQEKKIGLR